VHTTDFALAKAQYELLFPGSPFFDAWVPRSHFTSADYDGENLSITRRDEKIYGMAFGSSPTIPANWNGFSIESRGLVALPEDVERMDEWDCYWASTTEAVALPERKKSDSEISSFLETHAPHSSVFPGNDEILSWIEIIEDGELVGTAALCRWQSGRVVVSSVATHSDRRGQGIGKKVVAASLGVARELGEEFLSLGVMHANESAHRLYQSMGFTLMHNFTYCERR
jgi:ribosomal protein S18 acetylase RimI-like enzyme